MHKLLVALLPFSAITFANDWPLPTLTESFKEYPSLQYHLAEVKQFFESRNSACQSKIFEGHQTKWGRLIQLEKQSHEARVALNKRLAYAEINYESLSPGKQATLLSELDRLEKSFHRAHKTFHHTSLKFGCGRCAVLEISKEAGTVVVKSPTSVHITTDVFCMLEKPKEAFEQTVQALISPSSYVKKRRPQVAGLNYVLEFLGIDLKGKVLADQGPQESPFYAWLAIKAELWGLVSYFPYAIENRYEYLAENEFSLTYRQIPYPEGFRPPRVKDPRANRKPNYGVITNKLLKNVVGLWHVGPFLRYWNKGDFASDMAASPGAILEARTAQIDTAYEVWYRSVVAVGSHRPFQ